MKVLSDNLLVGLPQNIRFLHVKQLEEEVKPGRTVLQEIIESDAQKMVIVREAKGRPLPPLPADPYD